MLRTRVPLLAALLLAAPAPLLAQDNGVIGSPDLRDFSLPGTRTTPPAVVEPAVPPPSPVTEPEERPQPAPQRKAPTPAPSRQTPAPSAEPEPAPAAPEAQAPTAVPAPELSTIPEAQPVPPAAPAEAAPVADAAVPQWAWWAGGAGVLALILIVAILRRRRRRDEPAFASEVREPAPIPQAAPPPPLAPPTPAPLIEVEFRPERLVTSDTQAAVHFDLVLRNQGDAEARNLRIEARLFGASGAELADINAYLSDAIDPAVASAGLNLPAGRGVQLTSSVALPRDAIRLVEMAGRPLFIPTVAVKVAHDGEGRVQRITRRYLVGIEPKEAGGKLGPFRIDIGPRIYRALGQRPIEAPAPPKPQRGGRVTLR